MTVDEILATGRYTDRRGRDWAELTTVWLLLDPWRWPDKPKRESMTVSEMRLLIERDKHRDECEGLGPCWDHPVPYVLPYGNSLFIAYDSGPFRSGVLGTTLHGAMDAAHALAVGE